VGVATHREGFLYHEGGFDVGALLDRTASGRALADYTCTRRWKTALEVSQRTPNPALILGGGPVFRVAGRGSRPALQTPARFGDVDGVGDFSVLLYTRVFCLF
jgi:hypothetical protein